MTVFLDTASNFHPYECDGPGRCIHCDRTVTDGHDPATCALCDDGMPAPATDEAVSETLPEVRQEQRAPVRAVGLDEFTASSEAPFVVTRDAVVWTDTGEVVRWEDPLDCTDALEAVRDYERTLRELKAELTRHLVEEAQRQGVKTLDLGDGRKVEIRGGAETVYDAEQLEAALRDAGMPEERIREVVVETVAYKVDARKAKAAASANPAYADAVEAARTVQEKPHAVSIKRR